MDDLYFSERQEGVTELNSQEISYEFWLGFVDFVNKKSRDGWFAEQYPLRDKYVDLPIMSDNLALSDALKAHNLYNLFNWKRMQEIPPTLQILDVVEFFGKIIYMPANRKFDEDKMRHYIISSDRYQGFDIYRSEINTMLRRCQHPYELDESGQITRIGPPILRERLQSAVFVTGNPELNQLLETARQKFQDPDLKIRKEALEKLWDAWERLKTILSSNKRASIKTLLDATVDPVEQSYLRHCVEKEAKELTDIGNNLMIRHTETDKESINESEHVDYLFHRLFALVFMILKARERSKR